MTNSSSSSFIFKKSASLSDIKKEVKKEMAKRCLSIPHDREIDFSDFDQYGISMLAGIEYHLFEAKHLDQKSFDEIFTWYSDDVLMKTLGISEDIDDFYDYAEQNNLGQKEFNDEQLRIIFIYLALCLILYKEYTDLKAKVTYECFENMLTEYVSWELQLPYWVHEFVYDVFVNNYEKGMEFFQALNVSPIELLQDFLDFNFVYFDGLECNSIFASVLLSIPSCVYGCNHMG